MHNNNKRGPGVWKFNNSLLDDETYTIRINELIENCRIELTDTNTSNQIVWEIIKIEIRNFTLEYSKTNSRKRNIRLNQLENDLKYLIGKYDGNTPLPNQIASNIEKLETEIESIYDLKAKGAMVRSRIQMIEDGEKSSKFFLSMEKSRQARKSIQSLKIENKTVFNKDEILEEVKFYNTLYKSNNVDYDHIDDYLSGSNIPIINKDTANIILCDGLFSLDECFESLSGMKLNKSPGNDGLSVEFYRHFWTKIGNIVLNSLNEGYVKKTSIQ